jgi:Brp/Blh family beta-carotene 15,15'-monooxygenase
MKDALPQIYSWIERFSRGAIVVTIVIFGLLRVTGIELNLSAQVTIALIGLLIGIPHGAIDHLISIPATPRSRFYLYIVLYIVIALVAGWMIATWNLRGFQVVVVMSSLHFGYGDASFRNEWRSASSIRKFPWYIESIYAIPAGFVPVILPLTDPRSGDALQRIHPTLRGWAGSNTGLLRNLTLGIAIGALLALILAKSFEFVIDLVLLGVLALTAPPLVAFATYFGFWHAARHTARLVPKLASARALASAGRGLSAIRAAITPGLYAVAGTIAIAGGLMLFDRHHFSTGLLWSTLVIIWALTVPHMLSTSRFDLRAIKG